MITKNKCNYLINFLLGTFLFIFLGELRAELANNTAFNIPTKYQINFSKNTNKVDSKINKCRPCNHKPNIFQSTYKLLHTVWTDGKTELYIPAYAWHNRFTYSSERIGRYNENPWGGGLGKGYYAPNGNWHGLYAFVFLDSHKYPEPIVGYAFSKVLYLPKDINLGGGFGLLVTQRPDINNGIPFPGALPWVFVNHKKVSVVATYIPGSKNIGNVLFLIGKILI